MKCDKCKFETDNYRVLNGHKRIHGIIKQTKICSKCKKEITLNQYTRHYEACGKKRKNKYKYSKEKVRQVSEWRRRTKRKAIEYKGGKCVFCGYNKCIRSLAFHHVNSEDKEFAISHKNTRSWDRIKEELKKCILVCSNCHGEIEDGMILVGDIIEK